MMQFYPVEKDQQTMVETWLKKPHVKEFYYGDGLKNTLRNLELFVNGINDNGKYTFDHWVAYSDGKPFAFLMTSPVEKEELFEEGKPAIMLDVLIGEEEFLGKGLAALMIREFIQQKFPNLTTVWIDPACNNPKAIHVYEKTGFKKVKEFIPSYNPIPHMLMKLELQRAFGYLVR